MKKLAALVLSLSMVLALAACGQTAAPSPSPSASPSASQTPAASPTPSVEPAPESISITHEAGTVEVDYDPQNIVALDMSALDVLDALGVGGRVTGMPKATPVGHLMSYFDNADVVDLGTLFELNMEALMALEPDVIFIGGRQLSQYEDLSKIAPVVYIGVPKDSTYIPSFQANVRTIASLFGLEAQAEDILSGFDKRIEALNQAAAGKTALVGIVTSGSFSTLGKTGRASLISNEIGFENLGADVDNAHGDNASFELILDKNPEYLFILDRDTAIHAEGSKTAQEVLDNEIVQKADAYQSGKIVYLTPDVWYLAEGGITATDIMLKDLEQGVLGK